MAKFPKPYFEKVVFEVRYAKGHRYLDRCGETLIEIEEEFPEWIPQEISPSKGSLVHLARNINLNFNSYKLDASQEDPKSTSELIEQVSPIVDIVCKNFGLSQFIRLGVRFFFLFPATSMEQAEEYVRKANLVSINPKLIEACGPNITAQKHVIIFESGNEGRRIEFNAVRREEARLPPQLLAAEPKVLPRGQREALIKKLQESKRYGEDPRFAMQVDVDNYEREPESFNVKAFVEKHEEFIREKLLGLLEVG